MEPVVIVGAGPAGLAAAVSLKRLGIGFTLFDREGVAGGSFHRMQRSMRLLSPRRFVNLPHFPYPGCEEYPRMPDYAGYLKNYAEHFDLTPERREILEIIPDDGGFEIRSVAGPNIFTRCVVVATGIFSHPVWPNIEGLEPQNETTGIPVLHARDWTSPEPYLGRRILIVGAGISGVAIAEECAEAGLQVIISRRSTRRRLVRPRWLGIDVLHWFRPWEFLPREFFGSLCKRGVHSPAYDHGYRGLLRKKKILELPEIKLVVNGTVLFSNRDRREVDVIVAATGYRYETPFLSAAIRRQPGGHPMTRDCESSDWPGLFFVGAPCGRRIDSEFLRGIASDAAHVAERIRRRLNVSR
jgi:putative flavoprotein involved in K+ transport